MRARRSRKSRGEWHSPGQIAFVRGNGHSPLLEQRLRLSVGESAYCYIRGKRHTLCYSSDKYGAPFSLFPLPDPCRRAPAPCPPIYLNFYSLWLQHPFIKEYRVVWQLTNISSSVGGTKQLFTYN